MPEKCMLMYAFVVTGTLQALVNKKKLVHLCFYRLYAELFFLKMSAFALYMYDSSTVIWNPPSRKMGTCVTCSDFDPKI